MTSPVRIPADVEREDKLLGPFTARQTALMAAGGLLLYGGYGLARPWMSPPAYLAMVLPVAGVLVGVALGRREGVSMDRFLLAAFRHARAPKRMVHAPEGVPPLPDFLDEALAREAGKPPAPAHVPCQGVDGAGLVHLGRDGVAAVAGCSTVNFELRSGAERQALVGGFARWLNSLTGPVQILVRSALVDLGPAAEALRQRAASLPHPALAAAAFSHADHLDALGHGRTLLSRQVLLAVREPGAGPAARNRATQRAAEAVGALAAAEVDVRPLPPAEVVHVLSAACAPAPLSTASQEVR